jgi:hypothetical protein
MKHPYSIPPGFIWSHALNTYVHVDGRSWDPKTDLISDKAGTIVGTGLAGLTGVEALEKMANAGLNPQIRPDGSVVVNSASDERVVNNVMRHEYRVLSDQEKEWMKSAKDHGLLFHQYLDSMGSSRELSLAKTKIEEAVMWAVKHITK